MLEGSLDATGRFRGAIDTGEEGLAGSRFVDRHFTAFLTDTSTNRTEQRKFDVRVSRDALHVYVARSMHITTGRRLYVTTYSPDGTPAVSVVEIVSGTKVLGKGTTNRFGLVRIDIPEGTEDKLEARAVAADGRHGREEVSFYERRPEVLLETGRSLYRRGEAIECRISSETKDLPILLLAWDADTGQTVFSRSLRLKDGRARVEIPYDKRFGRKLSLGVASGAEPATAARAVLFPGHDDLIVRALPAKATYRPGETASIQFQASAQAALGVAIIDERVLERAATDHAFARHNVFETDPEQTRNIGGVTERDLATLDPSKIDGDLQLLGEVLIDVPTLINRSDDIWEQWRTTFAAAGHKALMPVKAALDDHYLQTLEYPRDETALLRIAGNSLARIEDPWMRPYFPRFTTEEANNVLCFMSAGPDKQLGTADDFCALKVERKWFANFEALIGEKLRALQDFPATSEQLVREMEDAGIHFEALRDPWGSKLRVRILNIANQREVQILSAGPDRVFGTRDDFVVATFEGTYFAAMSAKIEKVLSAVPEFPRTTDQFRAVLRSAGIDFDSFRDPWGRSYYAVFLAEEQFSSRLRIYSYEEYNGVRQDKKELTTVKQTALIVEIRSVGDDGVKGTYDDFNVISFRRVSEDAAAPEKEVETIPPPAFSVDGTGTVAGVVTDASGAVIPQVRVILNDVYVTHTDERGWYFFRGMTPGMCRLKFESPGFQIGLIDRVPVKANHLTRADTVMQIGGVTETVTVEAAPAIINTASMSMGMVAAPALSTPRVREYFPETLYWKPELVTDASGLASLEVKLADSITTWRVAVIGSTRDGLITEASAHIRAFQPFLVDLDVPPVLTTGDEIALPVPVRNYLDRAQNVTVSAAVPKSLALLKPLQQPGLIASSSSGNAVLSLRASEASSGAKVRVTALGGQASDAIEKPLAVHPDGESKEITLNGIAGGGRLLRANIPSHALPGSIRAEVKFYPSLLARVLESMESLLERPHGCGEQTISSTYPNLLFLKALKDAGIKHERLEAKALKNLQAGYQRLLGYQAEEGGFTYWGHGEPDAALTTYALSFLRDAKEFIEVDDERPARAVDWLRRQDVKEGGAKALQVRALAQAEGKSTVDLDRKLGEMARRAAEFDDPYATAAFVLAAIDAGKPELARRAVEDLDATAQDEQGAAYWSRKSNTPFHGWGRSGQVETTALVVSALAKWRKTGDGDASLTALIDRGALFLVKNAEGKGGWSTTQSTVRALAALLDIWAGEESQSSAVELSVNGVNAGKVAIPRPTAPQGPIILDVSRFMRAGMTNEISLMRSDSRALQAQLNATWYEPWGKGRSARHFALETRYSTLTASINQPITCEVLISRPMFQGYGMMIAEIGLPPGAEVDRGTLASVVEDPSLGVDSFEVAPDHVTFYVWPRAAESKFHFVFRPRFQMKARTAQSVLYDYYNPDERAVLPPEKFTVGEVDSFASTGSTHRLRSLSKHAAY